MKFHIPIYSMRSYDTGKYSVLKDGNFKLHINRMDRNNDLIMVPEDNSDLDEFLDLGLVRKDQIRLGDYGFNAVDTREKFWNLNQYNVDNEGLEIVTDITGYAGHMQFNNNFNITKLPNLDREYIDKFFDIDILSIYNANETTVLNQCQKDYIVFLYPELETKIRVDQKVISDDYFNSVGFEEFPGIRDLDGKIFFPFRISDSAYKWNEVLEEYESRGIVITDPNESYTHDDVSDVTIIKPNKRQFYWILSQKPTIIYNEDPNMIFHPGLADMIYFDCNIISPYRIPTLEEVLI